MDNIKDLVSYVHNDFNFFSDAPYVFQALADQVESTEHSQSQELIERVLFESYDPGTKAHLNTYAMLDPALRLICNDEQVQVSALPYSTELLNLLYERLQNLNSAAVKVKIWDRTNTSFLVKICPAATEVEESQRLQQVSSLEVLRQAIKIGGDEARLFGGFAFDYIRSYEDLAPLPSGANSFSDYQFYLARTILHLDHKNNSARISRLLGPKENREQACLKLNQLSQLGSEVPRQEKAGRADLGKKKIRPLVYPSDNDFAQIVEKLKEHIWAGNIFQVVPARTFTLECHNAFRAYLELRQSNPAPYLYYLRTHLGEAFGASPESSLKFDASTRSLSIRPIAGTKARAFDENGQYDLEEDTRRELSLRTDSKENAEHIMLVDLARNDLARVCEPGSRQVTSLLVVEKYSRLMHLVSEVSGRLLPQYDALDAYRACMNMGTLSGAPKLRATELLQESEKMRRGLYGGAVGYLSAKGDFDTCIAIRSAFVRNNLAHVTAGAGVVRDSSGQREAKETEHKASAVLIAIAKAGGKILDLSSPLLDQE